MCPFPLTPMRGSYVNPLPRFRVDPSGQNPPARENERMRAVPVDDGQFEIAIERRAGNGLPHVQNL